MTIHWKAVEQYFTVVLLVKLENKLSVLDLALSAVKGLKRSLKKVAFIQRKERKLKNGKRDVITEVVLVLLKEF